MPYQKLILVTNELLLHEITWMELINIMLKEKNQVREQIPLDYKTFYKSYSNRDCGICKGRNKEIKGTE